MNYYNPYFYSMPYTLNTPKVGLFSRLFGGNRLTLGTILSGTQKALGFANQAIPVVKQATPIIKNAKTMFKVMNEFKRTDSNNSNKSYKKNNRINSKNNNYVKNETLNSNEIKDENTNYDGYPTFFM